MKYQCLGDYKMHNINKTMENPFDEEYGNFNHWIEVMINSYCYENKYCEKDSFKKAITEVNNYIGGEN